ncbi:hypothetical protein M1D72_06450 [Vibrio sp. AK197]|uniref:Cytochrome oxidase biogenesis cluster protein n=1 Tax=Vibrio olivae TaxID=1243002 RepID=A0ABV5HMD5_9VIBR
MTNRIVKGRLMLIGLVSLFAIPVFVAKAILVNQWYQPGVTNRGVLIEPRVTYQSLGVDNPFEQQKWQLGYVLPEQCGAVCQQQLHLLQQSHIALGKYQTNVEPVVFVTPQSDTSQLDDRKFTQVAVSPEFLSLVQHSEYVIVDPLGQLVMRYLHFSQPDDLVEQSKGILADLRKMLKLSRVG